MSHIRLDPEGASFVAGKTVTCKADGYPPPSFLWTRTSDNATEARGAKLYVKSANYGYKCHATNKVRGRSYTLMSDVIISEGICQQFVVF